MMSKTTKISVVALLALISCCFVAADEVKQSFDVSGFVVAITQNGGLPKYEFMNNNTGYCDPSQSGNNCGPYEVWWRSIGEFDCFNGNPKGGDSVNLNSIDWQYSSTPASNTSLGSFVLSSGGKIGGQGHKPTISDVSFEQSLIEYVDPVTNASTGGLKFSIVLTGYEYGDNANDSCVGVQLLLSSTGGSSGSSSSMHNSSSSGNSTGLHCSTSNTSTTASLGNAFIEMLLNETAIATNPNNPNETREISVNMICDGGYVYFAFGHFPNGWTVSLDPTQGVAPQPIGTGTGTNSSSSGDSALWWIIGGGVVGVICVLGVCAAIVIGLIFFMTKKRTYDEV